MNRFAWPVVAGFSISLILFTPVGAADTRPADDGAAAPAYRRYAQLTAEVERLARDARVTASSIGRSWDGREIWMLTIAGAGPAAVDERPGLLIVGGINTDQPVSVESALRSAEGLLAAEADSPLGRLLSRFVVYVAPCVHPDGYEAHFDDVRIDRPLTSRPIDDDRDGVTNEDGPNDLNGDGRISVMRIPDPRGAWLSDPDEPRLLRQVDASKGERGLYRLELEGLDNDADGMINEDPPGGVDLDRNWPHFFAPGSTTSGLHPMSEPESRSLAEFVVAQRNLAAAIVIGRHDNVVEPPSGRERGIDGQSYRDLHPDDQNLYKFVSTAWREISGHKTSPGADPSGAFYAWLYNQRGIPTFALRAWWPLDEESDGDKPSDGVSGASEASPERDSAGGPASEASGGRRSGGARAVGARPAGRGARAEAGRSGEGRSATGAADGEIAARVSGDAKRWLQYLDRIGRGEEAAWAQIDHPEFGQVELGGLPPMLAGLAPSGELPVITERLLEFIGRMEEWQPRLTFVSGSAARVGGDVWRIEAHLANDGAFPTHCAMAGFTREPGFLAGPDMPAERILGGTRPTRVENVPGYSAVKLSWLVRGSVGDRVPVLARQRRYGAVRFEIELVDGAEAGR